MGLFRKERWTVAMVKAGSNEETILDFVRFRHLSDADAWVAQMSKAHQELFQGRSPVHFQPHPLDPVWP